MGSRMLRLFVMCMVLLVITLAVYMQVGNHEFVNFDDEDYVTKNPNVTSGLSRKNIVWAFSTTHSSNWHPITWLSHMADAQLYGMNPVSYTHLTLPTIYSV